MKALLLTLALAFATTSAFAEYRDCNLPENTAVCEAEFAAKEAQKAIDQAGMTNAQICEKYSVCGGGSGGM